MKVRKRRENNSEGDRTTPMDPMARHGVMIIFMASLVWMKCSAAPMQCHFNSQGETRSHDIYSKSVLFGVHLLIRHSQDLIFSVFDVSLGTALCEYDGKQYSMGESWMEQGCVQCTCLHPVGVGCCET